jgi:hypothetical protein
MVKIIAHYLPQFHAIPENNEWWGKDYTDWSAIKGARPLFKGHDQPRRPLGGHYYSLDDVEVLRWQARLALEHGIYGFCFRHHWFNGKLLWEKPAELLLSDKELKLPFCFAWANKSLTRAGYGQDNAVLIEQLYGQPQDWENHFSYVARFFEDPRYIKIDKKPAFLILDSSSIPECGHLLESWNDWAVERGFPGLYFIQILSRAPIDRRPLPFSTKLYLEPGYTVQHTLHPHTSNIIDYDEIYQTILQRAPGPGGKEMLGVFTDWDNSPRRGTAPEICSGSTPAKFEEYLLKQIERSLSLFNGDLIFINGWNEWADGAYLEPDERSGTRYLEAVKKAARRSSGLNLPLFYRTIF